MYLLGHSDPTLTMRVYQQVLDVPAQAIDDLEGLLGCTLDEAQTVLSGYGQRGLRGDPASRSSHQRGLSAQRGALEAPR